MAYSKTCKRKRKPNWMQGQLFTLAQMVNENRDIIKGKFGVGITSKTKGDTFLKAHYCQMFLKWLHFRQIAEREAFQSILHLMLCANAGG